MRRRIVLANWRVGNYLERDREFLHQLAHMWRGVHQAEVAVLVPHPYIEASVSSLEGTNIGVGAQDVSHVADELVAGDVSAAMLHDLGCRYVLLGHTERRRYHGERYAVIARKYKTAVAKRLTPVLCLGEMADDRAGDQILDVIGRQLLTIVKYCGLNSLASCVIVYQPEWSVGESMAKQIETIRNVHEYIREVLGPEGEQIRIVYGGIGAQLLTEQLFAHREIDGVLLDCNTSDAYSLIQVCMQAEQALIASDVVC